MRNADHMEQAVQGIVSTIYQFNELYGDYVFNDEEIETLSNASIWLMDIADKARGKRLALAEQAAREGMGVNNV